MKKGLCIAALLIFCAGVAFRGVSIWNEREAEIVRLSAQVEALEAKNAALEASRRAIEFARAENSRREKENADAVEKIISGDMPDAEYFDALLGVLRQAFSCAPAGAASGTFGGLPGAGSQ